LNHELFDIIEWIGHSRLSCGNGYEIIDRRRLITNKLMYIYIYILNSHYDKTSDWTRDNEKNSLSLFPIPSLLSLYSYLPSYCIIGKWLSNWVPRPTGVPRAFVKCAVVLATVFGSLEQLCTKRSLNYLNDTYSKIPLSLNIIQTNYK